MNQFRVAFLLTVVLALAVSDSFGRVYRGESGKAPTPSATVAANCSPATASTELKINNTRALIHTGGDMWWDLIGTPQYEIPQGSGRTALFAGSLWLGGQDVSGQLKVAAQRFRGNGNDYWTGPLSTITAEIDPQTCLDYDEHYVSTRQEVVTFVSWFEAGLKDVEDGTSTQQDEFPGYQIPDIILDWPAHGRNFDPYNEDFYLAPFYDRDGDGVYNPLNGDYPGYDLKGEVDCSERIVNIYGDENLWWIFNDKGNVHTETGANSIGMEIRGQAFAFATNDEVNNMTFYNYELINRSTFTLTETYFAMWVDADLGCSQDDYVGCDVRRGLGYCYNGDENDEDCSGAIGYGQQPPAIGVDFFQGPFQDNDGLDNPLTTNYDQAIAENGIPYAGIGIGYGDGIVDNERFGMRKFLYHNNDNSVRGDPSNGIQYYAYMRSFWRDNSRMVYGGTGHQSDPTALIDVNADYMFPDDTDPIGWGTGGDAQEPWNEVTSGNTPFDRRFMQSAGPFTLQPGALNNITVGVVWAQATSGGAFASVQALRQADDKTQALFDNCFRVLNGPDAPELSFQELDQELIVYIENPQLSNNFNEGYVENDPFLIVPDSLDGVALTDEEKENFNKYRFQGYQIYQVKDPSVSANDLDDPDKSRLVFQCDIRDGVGQIVNYYFDEELNGNIPVEEVDGNDQGISHSFKLTEDLFAEGDRTLVNHKTYYFIGIAYSYNNYKTYDPNNPTALDGQTRSYLASRKSATGGIQVRSAIPHPAELENGGTILNSQYGDGIALTRIEGVGNGGTFLEMTQESLDEAMSGPPWRVDNPTYLAGASPVDVKVIDPLNVPTGDFTLAFRDTATFSPYDTTAFGLMADGYWQLWNQNGDTVNSANIVVANNEQLVLDWGIAVQAVHVEEPGEQLDFGSGFIGASISYDNPEQAWLTGVEDVDGTDSRNWIRSGTSRQSTTDPDPYDDYFDNDGESIDPAQDWEDILNGIIAPTELCSQIDNGPLPDDLGRTQLYQYLTNNPEPYPSGYPYFNWLHSVNIVITSDKSKWTRCPVVESQDTILLSEGNVLKGRLRDAPSVDKDGNPAAAGSGASDNENAANYIAERGMGWFPGYAIDIETGERLNMMFAEDSWLKSDNGADMLWNPSENIAEGAGWTQPPLPPPNTIPIDWRLGGKHFVYVFRNNDIEDGLIETGLPPDFNYPSRRMPAYDAGAFAHAALSEETDESLRSVYRASMWTMFPMVIEDRTFLATDATIKLRVNRPYSGYANGDLLSPGNSLTVGETYFVKAGPIEHEGTVYKRGERFVATGTTFLANPDSDPLEDEAGNLVRTVNGARPLYTFNTDDLAAETNVSSVAEDLLGDINVVPNPYYAYSTYEGDKLDTRVKVINLPQTCTITIYTVDGTLVRQYDKDDPTITSVDWDLKNQKQVPVASGVYIIHVEVPGVGEKILKWFGVLRPIDLDAF